MLRTLNTLALLLAVLAGALGAQNVYYFDQDGGNDGNAGTEASPKASITWLNANAQQGDICLLQAGDTFPNQLRPTSPNVTVASYGTANGGRATITLGSTLVWIDQQGILLKDLELTGGSNGIYLDGTDTSRFTAVNVDSHTNTINGFNTSTLAGGATGDAILLLYSFWHDNGTDGVGVRGTVKARVEGGRIYDNGDDGGSTHESSRLDTVGVEITGNEDGLHHTHNTGRSLVERCWIHGNQGGDALSFFPVTNVDGEVLARSNVIVLPAAGVTADDSCIEAPSSGNLIAVNNTFQNLNATGNNAYCVLLGGTATATIANNLFLGADSSRAWMTRFDVPAEGVTWERNAYQVGFASLTTPFRIGGGGVHTFSQWQALTGFDAESFTSPGTFGVADATILETDPLGGVIARNGPLAGMGLVTPLAGLYEYRGLLRGRGPDIGAFHSAAFAATESKPVSRNAEDFVYSGRTTQWWTGVHPVGTTPTFCDLTRHIGTLDERVLGGGRRLVITSPTAAVVKIALGYDLVPAADPAPLGVLEQGVTTWAFPGGPSGVEFLCGPETRITSFCAVSDVHNTRLTVTVDP